MTDKVGELTVAAMRLMTPIFLAALTYIGNDITTKMDNFTAEIKATNASVGEVKITTGKIETNQISNMRRIDSLEDWRKLYYTIENRENQRTPKQ